MRKMQVTKTTVQSGESGLLEKDKKLKEKCFTSCLSNIEFDSFLQSSVVIMEPRKMEIKLLSRRKNSSNADQELDVPLKTSQLSHVSH